MRRTMIAGCAVLTLVGASACAGGGNAGPKQASPARASKQEKPPNKRPILVRVDNKHWTAIRVGVISGGQAQLLGTVETTREATFTMPRTIAPLDVRLTVTPIGEDGQYETAPISAREGEIIVMRVDRQLSLSTISVRAQSNGDPPR